METLYPYFLYDLFGRELDSLPVTDGTNSYWLIPLIIGFDTEEMFHGQLVIPTFD